VANFFDGTVSGYRIDGKTGALTPLKESPFPTVGSPRLLAVDSKAEFIYVASLIGNTVSGYRIDQKSGALTQVTGSPFLTGRQPETFVASPTGKFAYVTNSMTTPFRVIASITRPAL
jgi:DNA-binding beta-propeller fold protein YncE